MGNGEVYKKKVGKAAVKKQKHMDIIIWSKINNLPSPSFPFLSCYVVQLTNLFFLLMIFSLAFLLFFPSFWGSLYIMNIYEEIYMFTDLQ